MSVRLRVEDGGIKVKSEVPKKGVEGRSQGEV